MRIDHICGVTVLTVGTLTLSFNNHYLEIVSQLKYPNPIYRVPESKILELGLSALFGEDHLVIRTSNEYPDNILAIPVETLDGEDYKLSLKLINDIFKRLPVIYGGDLTQGVRIEDVTIYKDRLTYGIRSYPFTDLKDFTSNDNVVTLYLKNDETVAIDCSHYGVAKALVWRLINVFTGFGIGSLFWKDTSIPAYVAVNNYIFYYHMGWFSVYDRLTHSVILSQKRLTAVTLLEQENGYVLLVHANGDEEYNYVLDNTVAITTTKGISNAKRKEMQEDADQLLKRQIYSLQQLRKQIYEGEDI